MKEKNTVKNMHPSLLSHICQDFYKNVVADMSVQERIVTVFRPLYSPLHILLQKIPWCSRLLDIGCGTGVFLNYLCDIESGFGVDIDARSIELAREAAHGKKLSFKVISDVSDLQNVDCTCVSCIDVLHHINQREQSAFIEKFSALLPSGGKVLLKDLEPKPRWKATANRITDYISTRSTVSYLNHSTAEAMLIENGFRIIDSGIYDMYIWSHYFIEAEKIE